MSQSPSLSSKLIRDTRRASASALQANWDEREGPWSYVRPGQRFSHLPEPGSPERVRYPIEALFGQIYEPPAECVLPGLEGLPWRTKIVDGDQQFLVMAPEELVEQRPHRSKCLASAFKDPMAAAARAVEVLRWEAREPGSYHPELADCSFVYDPSHLRHCVDAAGALLATGRYKEQVATRALQFRLGAQHPGSLSFDQFRLVAAGEVVAPRSDARRGLANVYDNGGVRSCDPAGEELRATLTRAYYQAPTLRQEGETRDAFITRFQSRVLGLDSVRPGNGVTLVELKAPNEEPPLNFPIVLHVAGVSRGEALRAAHGMATADWEREVAQADASPALVDEGDRPRG